MRTRARLMIRTATLLAVTWFVFGLIEILLPGPLSTGARVTYVSLLLIPIGFVVAAWWLVRHRHDSNGKTLL